MEGILNKLNLGSCIPNFAEEKITPDIVGKLSAYDLELLGLSSRTNMMRLRVECVKFGGEQLPKINSSCGAPIELKITGTLPPIGLAYDQMKPNFTSSCACSTSSHARLCCETFSRDHFGEVICGAYINGFFSGKWIENCRLFGVLSYIFVLKVYLKHILNPTD